MAVLNMEALFEQLIDGIVEKGYAVIDQFLPESSVAGLAALSDRHFADGAFKEAGIGKGGLHQQHKAIRGDSILWLEPDTQEPFEQEYLQQVSEFISYMNRTCFTGLHDAEIHYARYPVGSFYKKHIDRFSNDNSRQYSLIMYLNADWKDEDGGELLLFLDNGQEERILPIAGRVVCFPSHIIPHEVLPARRLRLSLTGWLKR